MKKITSIILMVFLILLLLGFCYLNIADALADDISEGTIVYVTANRLNGRAMPRKSSHIEALFDYGDVLKATGKWSQDHKWIEVEGGECGFVWVDIRYVSEIIRPITIETNQTKVKIRKTPFHGRITGYLRNGKELEIDQIVLGWGHSSKGWIDLDYCCFINE